MRTEFPKPIALCLFFGLLPLSSGLVRSAEAKGARDGALAIGSSMSVSHLMPDGGDGLTQITIPNGAGLLATSPGFRAAHVSAGRGFEFGIDFGLLYLSGSGTSVHDVIVGLDAAGFGAPRNETSPFIGVEAGLHDLDFFGQGNQPYFGVAFGVRHIVASDHGAFKFGVGFRRFLENQNDGLTALNTIEFKVAFDLWVPH